MKISVGKDSEFSITMKDFIETLFQQDKFELEIWVTGSELPYEYDDTYDFHFMSEGVRITHDVKSLGKFIDYMLYDTIVTMRLIL